MKFFKLAAVAAALAGAALSASAMTSIQDDQLSQVTGQDGVSIVANLNINIGSFEYSDSGASVAFNNIDIKGMMAMTIDVLDAATFQGAAVNAVATQGGYDMTNTADQATVAGIVGATAVATGYVAGSDVVQFAFPVVNADARTVSPTITVGSITTGHGGASFGSFALNHLDLQGTQVWMYGHN
jgi:hypothetical protein